MPGRPRKTSARREAGGSTRKATLSLDADVLDAVRDRVAAGGARSLSAYASAALSQKLADDAAEDAYAAFLHELDAVFGPPTEAERSWAHDLADR